MGESKALESYLLKTTDVVQARQLRHKMSFSAAVRESREEFPIQPPLEVPAKGWLAYAYDANDRLRLASYGPDGRLLREISTDIPRGEHLMLIQGVLGVGRWPGYAQADS